VGGENTTLRIAKNRTGYFKVRFRVHTAMGMKMAVFYDDAPCSPRDTDRSFRNVCNLLRQGVSVAGLKPVTSKHADAEITSHVTLLKILVY
jgi:hypothetical protein